MSKIIHIQAEAAYKKAKSEVEKHLLRDGLQEPLSDNIASADADSKEFNAWLDKIAIIYFKGAFHKRISFHQIAYILILLADFKEAAAFYFSLLSNRKASSKETH